ncbi:MAG: eukaryotic-like serine/threonine-protein kinase [Solirubrobacteraceae bacterium]|nr:eukaryotic-like serine/threonine-protein kinase [Solirubrobacteraceae bacterium]
MAGPAKLDRYRVVRILGTGGMGTVSLAEDTILGRQVALKRVHRAAGDSGPLRLRREALLGASMSHPNLVSIYDVDETEDGDLVIVMEYVEGETLRDALARDGGLGSAEALRILTGAAAGLDAIHAQGIVHRDVKPANVLLGRNGDVKIADLGIAAVPDRTQITTSGSILGSLGYMAPEQMREAEATPAIDIYALAAVAYEALSGQKARREPNPVALAYAMDNKPPPDLREVWPQAPAAAAELLTRAMDRDPARRPRSAGELVARLKRALESPPTTPISRQLAPSRPAAARPTGAISAPATVASRRRRSPGALAIGLLALIAAGVIAAVVLASEGNNHTPAGTAAHHQASPAASASSSTTPRATASSTSSSATASSSAASSSATTPAAGSPGDTAKSFYTLAAGHRYPQAWALADPSFQSQLGGYQSFQNTFSGDRSITVNSLRTLSTTANAATVAIATTSVRTDGTQHCSGTVQLSAAGAKAHWLMDHIQINCQ